VTWWVRSVTRAGCLDIGVNDVWHSERGKGTKASDYQNGLRDVIARVQNAGATPILATPPLIGEKPNGQNRHDTQLDEFAELSRNVATRFGVTVCDLRTTMPSYSRIFNESGAAKGVLTTDEVHFSALGNRFVANQAALSIYEALATRR
jgi:lysophospholipase L1-like esterase